MFKRCIAQFAKILVIFVALMMIILAYLFATGQIQVWGGVGKLGLLSPDVRDLPSYYNPAIETIWLVEIAALFLLPIVLFILRRRLQLPVLPWAIVALTVLFTNFIWPAYNPNKEIDISLTSELPYFFQAQIPVAAAMVVGYGCSHALRLIRTGMSHRARPQREIASSIC